MRCVSIPMRDGSPSGWSRTHELRLESVAVESLQQSVDTLLAETAEGLRNAVAPRWLIANRRTFVMDDCLSPADPRLAPEPYLVEAYGVRDEMLQPVFMDAELVAIMSVHYTQGPRQWTEWDVSRIERAGTNLHDVLRQAPQWR